MLKISILFDMDLLFLTLAICQVVEDIAAFTGNPFTSGFVDNFDEHDFLQDNIITPCPPQDANGNRLELKLTRTLKLPHRQNFGTPNRTEIPNVLFKAQRARPRTTQLCLYGHPKVITFPPI